MHVSCQEPRDCRVCNLYFQYSARLISTAKDPCALICSWVYQRAVADGTRVEGSTDVCVEGVIKV